MVILQIINNLGSGGAEKLLSDLVPIMRNKGHEIEILLLRRTNSIYISVLESKGFRVRCLSENSLFSFLHVFRMSKVIKTLQPDIIHVHIFPSLYWAGLISLINNLASKFIFTEHSNNNRRRDNKIFAFLDKIIYARYSKIIGITDKVSLALADHLKSNRGIITIQNGIDLSKYDIVLQASREFILGSICPDVRIVTMIGRFTEAKDQKTLVRSLNYLPENIILLLVGEGPLRSSIEELVKLEQLDNRVKFLGLRNDIPEILASSDIGVLSSHWEGMPLSAIEIMASGIPFIGSKVPGIQDLVEEYNDDAGLLFEHENAEELASHINLLLSDKHYYKKIADACKERSKKYSIEKMVDRYLELYKEVLNEK